MVDQLVLQQSKFLWVPRAECTPGSDNRASDVASPGRWVSILEACFLSSLEASSPSKVVISVARRAGLNIPSVPSHILQVGFDD